MEEVAAYWPPHFKHSLRTKRSRPLRLGQYVDLIGKVMLCMKKDYGSPLSAFEAKLELQEQGGIDLQLTYGKLIELDNLKTDVPLANFHTLCWPEDTAFKFYVSSPWKKRKVRFFSSLIREYSQPHIVSLYGRPIAPMKKSQYDRFLAFSEALKAIRIQ